MLRLIESGAKLPTRAGWTLASSMVHGSLIALAVTVTMRGPLPAVALDPPESLVYTVSEPPPPAPEGAGVPRTVPRPSLGAILLPLIPGFRVDLPFSVGVDPSEFAPGAVVAPGGWGGTSPGVVPAGVHSPSQVDRAVAPRHDNPRPDYPAGLRAASLEGNVVVRFVVDTNGMVEQGSVAILQATHGLFGDAVRRWLPRTRYSPAEAGGRRVRQLVEQRIDFLLAR